MKRNTAVRILSIHPDFPSVLQLWWCASLSCPPSARPATTISATRRAGTPTTTATTPIWTRPLSAARAASSTTSPSTRRSLGEGRVRDHIHSLSPLAFRRHERWRYYMHIMQAANMTAAATAGITTSAAAVMEADDNHMISTLGTTSTNAARF